MSADAVSIPSLVVPTQRRVFAADATDAFIDHTSQVDANTLVSPIVDPADVALDDNGKLRTNGYRLTYLAVQQLGKYTATGLTQLVTDIGGIRRSRRGYDGAISVATAARILNACVKLRFRTPEGLYGRQLLQNNETRVVDGIVGPSYRYLPHRTLYEAASDMLRAALPPATFHEVVLIGRRLSMVFHFDSPLFTLADGATYGGGYYFANSEVGECGVHAAFILTLLGTSSRCLAKPQTLAHTGRAFTRKLGGMLASTVVDANYAEMLRNRAEGLSSIPLSLTNDKGIVNAARRRRLVQLLHGRNIAQSVAATAVDRAIYVGAGGDRFLDRRDAGEFASRTAYDLFRALMSLAEEHHSALREQVERTAFDLLTGRFNV